MKTLLVARKTLLEILREPQLLGLELALPLFFMVITYIGYGNAPKLPTHRLLILAQDQRAAGLVDLLRNQRYNDGRPVYDLAPISDRDEDEKQLKDQSASALVVLTGNASGQLTAAIRGDATAIKFTQASTLLGPVIERYLDSQNGQPELINIVQQPLNARAAQNDFDAYLPGMMIFAILLLIPQTAMLVGREIRRGTLTRLKLSRITAWELLGGVSLSQMVMAVLQVLIIFAGAFLLGFHNRGSLWLAMLAGVLLSFSAIGPGLIVACLVSDDSQALNIGGSLSMIGVFLTGAWFPMPASPLFSLGGHEINIYDAIPATHGMLALQRVLVGGAGFGEVSFRLAALFILSLIVFAAGVITFSRIKLNRA